MDRNALVLQHAGLVKSIAAKVMGLVGAAADFDELVSLGQQGLVEAAGRYDPDRGIAFSTFAYYRVRGAMFDGLRKTGLVGSGRRRAGFEQRADAYLEQMASEPAPPTATAAAERLAGAVADLAVAYVASRTQVDETPDTTTPDPAEVAERKEQLALLRRAMDELPENERRLIDLMYFQDLGLVEAGERLGMSKGWASRLHARALGKLRELAEGEVRDRAPPVHAVRV